MTGTDYVAVDRVALETELNALADTIVKSDAGEDTLEAVHERFAEITRIVEETDKPITIEERVEGFRIDVRSDPED